MEADVTGMAGIVVKADTSEIGVSSGMGAVSEPTSLLVGLTYATRLHVTRLLILPPLDTGLSHRFVTSYFASATGLSYHPIIEIDAGLVRTSIRSPGLWPTERKQPMSGVIDPVSLISVGESLAYAVGDSVTLIAPERGDFTTALDHPVTEMRLWESASEPQIGICVPDQHQVFLAPAEVSRIGYIDWPFGEDGTPVTIGTKAGQKPGAFFYPLSFDVAGDGRIFVLDAGNRHIQAFDSEGNYITQWGSEGADVGPFDFLDGLRPQEFSGSLIVDDDGFIYVADVGNKRIQKFAP